ncbi:DUF4386 family protein [Humibacillus xanthopallidus]|nr:DUF4386 family protein [Humibacillus xanthopallidus]
MLGSVRSGRSRHGARVRTADPQWRELYRIGGVCAWLFVALIVVAIVIVATTPMPPSNGGAATLDFIAAHRMTYIVEQQLWLVPGVFAMVTYLALYPALKDVNRSLASLGSALGGVAWALTLALPTTTTGAPALVYLSDQYAAATDAAARAGLAAAAEALVAQNRTTVAIGPLTTVAMLVVSVVMIGGVFPRAVAYLGIVTGLLGIAAEVLRMVVEGFYGIYGVLLPIWMAAVGWQLYRLGRAPDPREGAGLSRPTPGPRQREPRRAAT